MTPLDQLRLRLTDHDFYRLMETAKPLAPLDRDAFLKDVAAELGRHEVIGPGLLHRIMGVRNGGRHPIKAGPEDLVPGSSIQTFGVRLRTFAFARSTLPCNFLRSTTAAARVRKKLLARRRVWPFRTNHSKEPSAHRCRRT
jgi:hypothetical protein